MARVAPWQVLLCLEDAAVSGVWGLWINGHRVPSEAFVSKRRWSVDTREADLTALLKPGDNDVVLRVSASESWDGLLDAVHLLGDFGVFRDDRGTPVFDRLPDTIRWAERHTSGYPFFSGTLRLSRCLSLPAPSGPFRLRLPDDELMFAGVAQLAINVRELGVRAWAPYVWGVPAGIVSPARLSK